MSFARYNDVRGRGSSRGRGRGRDRGRGRRRNRSNVYDVGYYDEFRGGVRWDDNKSYSQQQQHQPNKPQPSHQQPQPSSTTSLPFHHQHKPEGTRKRDSQVLMNSYNPESRTHQRTSPYKSSSKNGEWRDFRYKGRRKESVYKDQEESFLRRSSPPPPQQKNRGDFEADNIMQSLPKHERSRILNYQDTYYKEEPTYFPRSPTENFPGGEYVETVAPKSNEVKRVSLRYLADRRRLKPKKKVPQPPPERAEFTFGLYGYGYDPTLPSGRVTNKESKVPVERRPLVMAAEKVRDYNHMISLMERKKEHVEGKVRVLKEEDEELTRRLDEGEEKLKKVMNLLNDTLSLIPKEVYL